MAAQAQRRSAQAAWLAPIAAATCAWLALAGLMDTRWWGSVSGLRLARGGASAASVGAFAGGWILMVLAMMLPTTLLLVAAFDERVAVRPRRWSLEVALLGAYVGVWGIAGVALELGAVAGRASIGNAPTLVGALALAGAYEFGSPKSRSLTRCRNPATSILRLGEGASAWRGAARAGATHGVACVGSSWALMFVMLGRGGGCSLGWMEVLTAAMVLERVTTTGHRARSATGSVLVAGAAALALGV